MNLKEKVPSSCSVVTKNAIDCGQKYFQGKIVITICAGSNVIASFKYRRKQLSNVHIMDDMVIAILGFE